MSLLSILNSPSLNKIASKDSTMKATDLTPFPICRADEFEIYPQITTKLELYTQIYTVLCAYTAL